MRGKTVIISGGSSGIGKALAVRFAQEGSNIVITGRNPEKLQLTEQLVKNAGAACLAVVSDVSNLAGCETVISQTLHRFGSIDILINNAGISMRGLLADTKVEVLEQVMATNFWGTVYLTKLALPHLIRSGGTVAGISSIAGKHGLPGRSAYSASKFAMEGFLQAVRIENIKTGLHVLVACPGFTASSIRESSLGPDGKPQGESPRNESAMMSSEDVADRIYSAIIKRKRDLVLTGNGKMTVFLSKFFPSLTDKLVYNHMAKEPGSPFK